MKTRFNDWMERRISEYGFVENQDYVTFTQKRVSGGRTKEYALSLDMAKELSMVERNEKGKEARRYFIECEQQAKALPAIPTHSEALRLAADALEENEKLKIEVEKNESKAIFYDKFASADGNYGLQNAARALGVPTPNKFISSLKRKWLHPQGGSWVPYASYLKQGIFDVKITMIEDKARQRTFVTPKGMQYFGDKLKKEPNFNNWN